MSRYREDIPGQDVHMDVLRGADSQQRHPMTGGRRADPGVAQPQHGASSRGSAEQQFNPRRNRILSEPSVSRTLSRHDHWPVPSLQDVINGLPSRNVGDLLLPAEGAPHIPLLCHAVNRESEERHVAQIVSEMEKDTTLMGDNPLAQQLRMEALREMPESLNIKRTIKRKLVKSVSQKSTRTPLTVVKRLKYRMSMSLRKFNMAVRNLLYVLELWYSSLKTVEGHFGSGVATYFRFLRLLFLLNTAVFVCSFGFTVIPQLLYRLYEPVEAGRNDTTSVALTPSDSDSFLQLYEANNLTTHIVTPVPVTTQHWKLPSSGKYRPEVESGAYSPVVDFSVGDLFTGGGYLSDTVLYYGAYTNESVSLLLGRTYGVSPAYFFTTLACYLLMFVVLSVSMARSYRRTFIETAGDLKSTFAHKVFCAWDFGTATSEAAALRSKSVYNELKELLADMRTEVAELSWRSKCYVVAIRISLNVFTGLVLASTGLIVWFVLHEETRVASAHSARSMVMPLVITVIVTAAPVLYSWMARLEDYASPRTALFVTLTRTFLMQVVVIGVVVAFWLTFKNNSECWETALGQEVYRLVITDFLLAVVATSLAEFVRFHIYKSVWTKIGVPEFDIARNTLNIIYNQTLLFVGLYFSPLLALVVILKMFVTFYVKKLCVLNNCQPSARPWRAAQTHTLFLVLCFVAALVVLILLGYIITQVESSGCGPFRAYDRPYEIILDVFHIRDEDDGFLQFIRFLTKPGVTAAVLLAMCVGVYYLRAKSHAQKSMVHRLREMLVLESKDKEFLLSSFSKVAQGQWIANLKTERRLPGDCNVQEELLVRRDHGLMFPQVSHRVSSLGDSTATD